jgi:mannose-6-phosphate isomerase-like protein (cupin superfamily)
MLAGAPRGLVMSDTVNLAQKFGLIRDYWSPKIAGQLNGQYVKLAKLKGEFVWHRHENEDELFLVVKGILTIALKDREVVVREGEFFIVPAGIEHRPVAAEEVHAVLLEPVSAVNTGNVTNERTLRDLDWI